MIVTSRDYTFTEQLDFRFTQYRCPVPDCLSYNVVSISISNATDASSNHAIGEGVMCCEKCRFTEKGYLFQFDTQSDDDKFSLKYLEEKIISETGDTWRYSEWCDKMDDIRWGREYRLWRDKNL